jgi:hypothetical protein
MRCYLYSVRMDLSHRTTQVQGSPSENVEDAVFRILTSRRFGHLGRSKSEPYRCRVQALLRRAIEREEPLRFFYDLGPGYHAGIRKDRRTLNFEIGLSEVLALRQVVDFCNAANGIYAPGTQFFLLIDNLCGHFTNDIPIERSEMYVRRFRRLISAVGAGDLATLLVESELFTTTEYRDALNRFPRERQTGAISDTQVENVARFLGRDCSRQEAADRMSLYGRTAMATETLLERVVDGVRLTQRAGVGTLGFRAFPGGDQRTQTGQLALTRGSRDQLKPVLITTANADLYELTSIAADGILPAPVRGITYAQKAANR